MALLENALAVFVKQDCPVCQMIVPVLKQLAETESMVIFTQDNPSFPEGIENVEDDRELECSFRNHIETVPTIIRFENGQEIARAVGWNRDDWQALTHQQNLGHNLPEHRPGCSSKSVEPGIEEYLQVRYGNPQFSARKIQILQWQDPVETAFDRGWTDGLPVVPPTQERLLRMLAGTSRSPGEVIGRIPPNLAECTVEKVAINAVLAGCKPEYMPVLLTVLEAALDPLFTLHGLTCSTCFSGPVIIVNGPIAKTIGMNSGINVLGPGNRANATIGRALNLIIYNIGGGKPGLTDRSTFGSPTKYTCCFAEDESDESWEPLSVSRGFLPNTNTVTLFQGDGVLGFIDQRSTTPKELINSLAMSLSTVGHPKLAQWCNAVLLLSAEHYAIFRKEGWDRNRIQNELETALLRPGKDLVYGAQNVGEGVPKERINETIPKFHPGGLLIVRAGGKAGLYSAILPGWTGGRFVNESQPVTKEIVL